MGQSSRRNTQMADRVTATKINDTRQISELSGGNWKYSFINHSLF